jgi:hypothetical protein
MAHSKRYLTLLFLAVAGTLFPIVGRAQPAPVEPLPVKFRTLAIGNTVPLAGLRYDYNRKPISILVGDTEPSSPYNASPSGLITFYRESPPVPPETKPRRIPVAEAQLGNDPMYWIVLVARIQSGVTTVTPLVINESWDAHPHETVRVLNFSKRKVAVKLGETAVEMAPSESHIFPYPSGDSEIVTLQTATNDAGQWVLRMNSPQGIIHGTRASIVISDVEPSQWDPHPEGINVINMIDTMTPPPKPTVVARR